MFDTLGNMQSRPLLSRDDQGKRIEERLEHGHVLE